MLRSSFFNEYGLKLTLLIVTVLGLLLLISNLGLEKKQNTNISGRVTKSYKHVPLSNQPS